MKKFITILLVLGLAVTAVFAADTEFPTGKWLDSNWDGIWEFGIDKTIKLWKTDGELVYNFTQDKITDYKVSADPTKGVILSFSCAETERSYQFIKPLTLSTDLELIVNPDWTTEDYETTIKFQLGSSASGETADLEI